jgi:hypothetical protein
MWESDICEVSRSKVAKLRSIEDGYKRSSIHVVEDRSCMDTTMVEIIFLIFEGRYSQDLLPREKGADLKQGLTTRWEYGL